MTCSLNESEILMAPLLMHRIKYEENCVSECLCVCSSEKRDSPSLISYYNLIARVKVFLCMWVKEK